MTDDPTTQPEPAPESDDEEVPDSPASDEVPEGDQAEGQE